MMCEKCHVNPASIHITENIRGTADETPKTPVTHHYCETCGRPLLPAGSLKQMSVSSPALRMEVHREPGPNPPLPEPQIDISRRYDIYCIEPTRDVVVYRNALFKGASTLLPGSGVGGRIVHHDFIELEQANGQSVFVSRSSIFRLCEPGTQITAEIIPRDKPTGS